MCVRAHLSHPFHPPLGFFYSLEVVFYFSSLFDCLFLLRWHFDYCFNLEGALLMFFVSFFFLGGTLIFYVFF